MMIFTLSISIITFGVILFLEIREQYWSDRDCPAKRKSYTPKTDKPKILFLGASTTFGFGLKEEDSFPYILQELVKDKYEVVNRAISGHRVQHISKLVDECKDIKPDTVFIAPLWNDVNYAIMSHTINQNKIFGKQFYHRLYDIKNTMVEWYGKNYFTLITWRLLHRLFSFIFIHQTTVNIGLIENQSIAFTKELEELIIKIKKELNNPKIIMLLLPSHITILGKTSKEYYLWDSRTVNIFNNVPIYTEIIERSVIYFLSQKHQLRIVDMCGELLRYPHKKKLFMVDDYHFTRKGNEIIANKIARLFVEVFTYKPS